MAGRRPIDHARRWWQQHVDQGRYVVSRDDAPSAAVARVLRQEGLVMDVGHKHVWILTAGPSVDRRSVFLRSYWPTVVMVLQRYAPAVISGISAVKLHLEDYSVPEDLALAHSANRSACSMTLEAGFTLRLKPRPNVPVGFTIPGPAGAQIPSVRRCDPC